MEALSLQQAAQATGGLVLGDEHATVRRVTTDSRDVRPGDLFACLRGEHHDGHDHAESALRAGAAAVLVERELPGLRPQLVVGGVLGALGALGAQVRRALDGARSPLVVGITGSNGKTTTKELTAAALAPRGPVVASERSFNNSLGVPLTLLRLDRSTRSAVLEIGTNAPGEIASLVRLVQPHVGVITNIQPAHLAGLSSVEGVRREKSALLAGLSGPRVCVLNRDDPCFEALSAAASGPVLSFGTQAGADVRGTQVECRPEGTRFRLDGRRTVTLRLLGPHAASNALAALAVARAAGVDEEAAVAALAHVASPPGRLSVRRLGDFTLVDDTYNANPGSFAAALTALEQAHLPGRLVVVAGEMLELGPAAASLHETLGKQVARSGAKLLVAVGTRAREVVAGARQAGLPSGAAHACATREEAGRILDGTLRAGDVVLFKGSRGARLEVLADRLAQGAGHAA